MIGEKIFDVVKIQNTKLRLVEDVASGRELEKCKIGVDEVLRITIEK